MGDTLQVPWAPAQPVFTLLPPLLWAPSTPTPAPGTPPPPRTQDKPSLPTKSGPDRRCLCRVHKGGDELEVGLVVTSHLGLWGRVRARQAVCALEPVSGTVWPCLW